MHNQFIYITGAAGFIGSNLVKKFIKKNISFFPVSRKNSNIENSIVLENYSDLNPKENSTLVHLAENNNPDEAELMGKHFIIENTEKISSLIKKKWSNIIYISTALLYDFNNNNNNKIINDNIGEVKANNIYKKSKIECEKIVLKSGGTVLRMTNLYGPGMSLNNVMSDILKQLNSDQIILKNLNAMRDFLWIEDAVEAIILANKSKFNDIFNIASNSSISIYELAQIFIKLYGHNKKKLIGLENSSNIFKPIININKTIKVLNWKPVTNLKTGIKYLLEETNKI